MRGEVGYPGCDAGALHCVPGRVGGEALEDSPFGNTIIRRSGRLTLEGFRSAFCPIHSCTSLTLIACGSLSPKIGSSRLMCESMFLCVCSPMSTRLVL